MKSVSMVFVVCALAGVSNMVSAQTDTIDISLSLNGAQVPNASPGVGSELGAGLNGCFYDSVNNVLTIKFQYSGLTGTVTDAHIHGPAAAGSNAGVLIGFTGANGFTTGATSGSYTHTFTLSATNETRLLSNLMYVNIHTTAFGGGEIRGQLINTNTFLPVELTGFIAMVKGNSVELVWKTATETNNHGFEVERRVVRVSGFVSSDQISHPKPQITDQEWQRVGFVEGNGTSNAAHSYGFTDNELRQGKYSYRLKQIDRDGSFEFSNVVEATVSRIVTEYALDQNYPNPFNPSTRISFQMPLSGHAHMKVYDMLGKEVTTLVDGIRPAGENIAEFTAASLPSGLYFYTLRTGNFSATKKMLLVK